MRFIVLFLILNVLFAFADKPSEETMISSMKSLRDQAQESIKEIDAQIGNILSPGSDTATQDNKVVINKSKEVRLIELNKFRTEKLLRTDFYNQLLHYVLSNYKNQVLNEGRSMKDFIQRAIIEFTQTEIGVGSRNLTPNHPNYLVFLLRLQQAIDGVKKDDRTVLFIEKYIQFSSISEPKKVEEFITSQEYTSFL